MLEVIPIVVLLDTEPTSWVDENMGKIVIGGIIAIISFAFFLGGLTKNVASLNKTCKDISNMKSDIKANKKEVGLTDKTLEGIDKKIDRMIDKFDNIIFGKISQSTSPIRLNEHGVKILKQSKVADIITEKYDFIIEQVRSKHPKNAYQTQKILFDVVAELSNDETLTEKLENGAFLSGSDVAVVLYAGAIDIRDRVVKELKFEMWDIDKEEKEHND